MASTAEIEARRSRWTESAVTGGPSEAFLTETFARFTESVVLVADRLLSLGYPRLEFIKPASSDLGELIHRIEGHTQIRIPRIVQEFWQRVGGVSLADLVDYRHVTFWDEQGISGPQRYCDAVHIDGCSEEWAEFVMDDFDNCMEDNAIDEFRYSLAPDGYHKDDISGGAPYSIGIDSDWLPAWENFHWSGVRRPGAVSSDSPDFLDYLRTSILECGGFPALLGHSAFEPIRRELIADLPAF